ncbi:MAG: MBOAT family protein [Lachnospiraceae bacterium]|nr:MBOAT family protein [Lachnospiraceae bacterium]
MPKAYRNICLLLISYYFYFSCSSSYTLILLLTTAVTYMAARLFDKEGFENRRKAVFVCALVFTVLILGFFKYFNFLSESITSFFNLFGLRMDPFTLKLVMPVGISFYTFQSLSYLIDVYKGKVKAQKNFLTYALYISFFPQVISGPIGRTEELMPQIEAKKDFDHDNAVYGLRLMLWGYFKKLIIADSLGKYVDLIFGNATYYFGLTFIVAAIMYTIQIYCDFSGYSEIAIGTARLFNINLMDNFKSPYMSKSVKEFWSRWHISLSTWFRDYIYFPLGGSRCSKLKEYRNLIITFLVSGLWHGANWTFVFWGGLHGLYQAIEKEISRRVSAVKEKKQNIKQSSKAVEIFSNFGHWLITFIFVTIFWIFFRADSISDALFIVTHLHNGVVLHFADAWIKLLNDMGLTTFGVVKLVAALCVLTVFDYFSLKHDLFREAKRLPVVIRWIIYVGLTTLIIVSQLYGGTKQTFIYFNF